MRKFVIVSDSCCEMDETLRKQYGIDYIPMYLAYEDKSLHADIDWKELSYQDLYNLLRNDVRIFTAQVTAFDYQERFEQYIKEGYDILSISCSSALSASIKASMVAREELLKTYPDAKIYCIDSLICGMGIGILCIYASKLRAQGKSIEETAQAVEDIKMNINQVATVDDLKYLKRAGRISSTTAIFGSLLNVKPIILSNVKGENVSGEKVKGRIKSLRRLAEMIKELYTGDQVEEIFISHGDSLENAEKLRDLVLELMPDAKINIAVLNPIMGASSGPECISAYFVGQPKPNI